MTPTLGRRPPASGPPLIRSTPTIVVSSSIVAVLRLLRTGSTRLSLKLGITPINITAVLLTTATTIITDLAFIPFSPVEISHVS